MVTHIVWTDENIKNINYRVDESFSNVHPVFECVIDGCIASPVDKTYTNEQKFIHTMKIDDINHFSVH